MRSGSVLALMVAASCGGDSYDGLLEPPPGDDGVQLGLKIRVEPGQELTVCKNFALPSGTFEIGRFEHAMNDTSHHLLVFPILLGASEVTDQVFTDCDENAESQGERVGFLYGSQSARGEVEFPKGYAMLAMSGIAIQLEFHIYNAGDEPIEAEAALNLWQSREEIIGDGGTVFAYNSRIALPPMSTGSARQRCPVAETMKLVNLTPHMHNRGVAMKIFVDHDGVGSPELIVDAPGWDEDTVTFDPPLELGPGDVLDIQCDYNNSTSEFVTDGASAKHDEMCVTGGLYYREGPRIPIEKEVCFGGIVYSGTKSCMEVEQCDRAIDYGGWSPGMDPTPGDLYDGCINSGCQAGATAYIRYDSCRWDQCRQVCCTFDTNGQITAFTPDTTECTSCVETSCPGLRDSCVAATCP